MIAAHHRSLWRFARRSTEGWRRLLLPVIAVGLVGRTLFGCGIRLTPGRRRPRSVGGADRRNAAPVE
jgi:hypothetical protein